MNSLTEYDLTRRSRPALTQLAIEGFNDALNAGVILGLHVELSNGQKVEVLSDRSWRVVPSDEPKWETRVQPKANWSSARISAFAGRQVWSRPEKVITSPQLLPLVTRFWQQTWFLLLLLAICAVVLVFSVWLGLQLAVQSRSHRLLKRERDRIARDIHDDLGSGLTQLTLLGELVLRETPHSAETHSRLNTLCGKSRALLSSMDEIVWTVNSRRDTVPDFAAFICEHTQEFLNTTAMRCRLDVADDLPTIPLDLPARRNLLLAVKEAVRNAAQHSDGSEVLLQLRVVDQHLRVVVEDNGKGLPVKNPRDTRNGLLNMAQRLADVGGVCRMVSAPGKGCRIIFTLPLESPKLGRKWLSPLAQKILSLRKSIEPDP